MKVKADAKKKLKKDKKGIPSIVGPFSIFNNIADVISKAAINSP